MKTLSNPFDFVKAINEGKHLIRESDSPVLMENEYVPYLTNKSFSYYTDTIFYANELNFCNNLDKLLQFDYYLNSIRPKKRFSKWAKKEDSDSLNVVMEYYKVGYKRANEIMRVLSIDQLSTMKEKLIKGG